MKIFKNLLIITIILIGLWCGGFLGKYYYSNVNAPHMRYFIEVTFPQMEKNNGTH